MKSVEIEQFMIALYQSIGNKVYMRNTEEVFSKLDLKPEEREAFMHLARDIQELKHAKERAKRNNFGRVF